jgi:hypothetical protein
MNPIISSPASPVTAPPGLPIVPEVRRPAIDPREVMSVLRQQQRDENPIAALVSSLSEPDPAMQAAEYKRQILQQQLIIQQQQILLQQQQILAGGSPFVVCDVRLLGWPSSSSCSRLFLSRASLTLPAFVSELFHYISNQPHAVVDARASFSCRVALRSAARLVAQHPTHSRPAPPAAQSPHL